MVIYEQRHSVLNGDDHSEQIRQWIEGTVRRNVMMSCDADAPEDWDFEGLVAQMTALYGGDDAITVEELREEVDQSREAIIEEYTQDALTAYDERVERFGINQETGKPWMRDIERFVILQVVDTRWREHLESMDYLREGVHLRAMAQKDPLVEYRGEGHQMFEELGGVIQEEVVLTLFHVEMETQEAEQVLQHAEAPQGLSYEHETAAGAEAIAAAGGLATAVADPIVPKQVINDEAKNIGRNDPCWCGSGKKYKRCHGQ